MLLGPLPRDPCPRDERRLRASIHLCGKKPNRCSFSLAYLAVNAATDRLTDEAESGWIQSACALALYLGF
jgi:hypothetical protein